MRFVDASDDAWHPRERERAPRATPALRCGLYDAPSDDPDHAHRRLDEYLADLAGLGAGPARLLDAACGVGDTSVHLLRRHPDLRVTGVSPARGEAWLARQLADAAGVGDRATFVVREQVDTGQPACTFDVVLAVAGLGRCDDRPRFAREALRLLVPGGRLVLADAFRSSRPLTALESKCYDALLRGLGLADCFARPPDEVFGDAGFVDPWFEDLTLRVLPGLQCAAERASVLLQNVQLSPLQRDVERALVAAHALCRSGALSYGAFRARTPNGDETR